ncbi:hypothetical protein [uncultured Sanguibacteroides sp.]|uniref:hypothetical protein n=1 Tax=uncultured Sanguibacteroides sp. TaxID=1635151 RepID=UPI0025FF34B0|nr:hypothetical protein [uncultured Sanguibacteroides sp.]
MKWLLTVGFIFWFGFIFAQEEDELFCARKFSGSENIQKVRVNMDIDSSGKVGLDIKWVFLQLKAEQDSLLLEMKKSESERHKWILDHVTCGKLELKNFRFFESEGDEVREIGYEIKGTLSGFCRKIGDRLFFSPFSFSGIKNLRLSPGEQEVRYPVAQKDTIFVRIPEGYVVEMGISPVFLYSPYGEYSTEISCFKDNLYLKRNFVLNAGVYPKEAYESFQLFIQQVQLQDRLQFVLKPQNK